LTAASSIAPSLLTSPSSSSVLSVLTPPPGSTLFPYTTLFRSRSSRPDSQMGASASLKGLRKRRSATALGSEDLSKTPKTFVSEEDRKSTRLNSSHQIISYAVFCLKKKKHQDR